ncbi:hypothetical protein PMI40_03655, partial [Herbaspirillum sp. YR522]
MQMPRLSRGLHTKGLMRPLVVVKANPVADDATGVLQGFE